MNSIVVSTHARLPTHSFIIVWPDYGDVHGVVIARAYGLNSERLPSQVQSVDIYRLVYAALSGLAHG